MAAACPHAVRPSVIKVWETATGKELASFEGPTSSWVSVLFSPDGESLAVAGPGSLALHDPATGKVQATLKSKSPEPWLAFTKDGKTLACGGQSQPVILWDVSAGKERTTQKGQLDKAAGPFALSEDGKVLAAGGGGLTKPKVAIWDVEKNTIKSSQESPGTVYSVALSPDGKTLAYGTSDGDIVLFDLEKNAERTKFKGHPTAASWLRAATTTPSSCGTPPRGRNEPRSRGTTTW
jgi:WD40 repeat protein